MHPGRLARELHRACAGHPMRANTAAGQVTSYATRLDSVQLGGITERDVWATINPGVDLDKVLLGVSFLKRLEIAQRGDTLTLRAPGD
ncbi:MAG: retropepsin-like aspartic protease [Gammaproteobacteria bacterium]|nr:retropepsin-like aspartic protease [Gammaproteobacteria bacterium]